MGFVLVRKLSTAKMVDGGKVKMMENETSRNLYRITGIARGLKDGVSNFGAYVEFVGDFASQLYTPTGLNGKGFRSPKAFFPEPFSSMLKNQLLELIDANLIGTAEAKEKKTVFIPVPVAVEFKVDIIAKADEKSSTGYIYEISPIIKLQESDALNRLLADSNGEMPKFIDTAPVQQTFKDVHEEVTPVTVKKKSGKK